MECAKAALTIDVIGREYVPINPYLWMMLMFKFHNFRVSQHIVLLFIFYPLKECENYCFYL